MSGSTSSPVVTTLTVDDAGLRKGLTDAVALLNGYVRSNEQAARALQQHGQAAETAVGGTRNVGVIMGQAGFQVQDFATQVSMGQNAMTAFAVQFAQFAGIFGTAGALAGAAVTAGLLGAQLLGVGQSTDTAKAAAEGYAESLKKLNELMETAAERARRVRQETAGAIISTQMAEMQRSEFLATSEGERVVRLERDIANLEALGRRLQRAGDAQAVAANESEIAALRDRLQVSRGTADVASASVRRSRELIDTARNAGTTNEEAYGPNPPRGLLERLQGQGRGGGGSAAPDREAAEAWRLISSALRDVDNATVNARAGFDRLVQSMDPAEAAAARNEERVATLADALSKGAISQEEFGRGLSLAVKALDRDMERATGAADGLRNVGREIGTVFTSAFDGMISGARGFDDALKRLQQGLVRLIERTFITKPLESALGSFFDNTASPWLKSVGSSISSAIGSLFGGGGAAVPARAVGGPVAAGAPYLVGEEGRELFVPRTDGTIVPNHVLADGGVLRSLSRDMERVAAAPDALRSLGRDITAAVAAAGARGDPWRGTQAPRGSVPATGPQASGGGPIDQMMRALRADLGRVAAAPDALVAVGRDIGASVADAVDRMSAQAAALLPGRAAGGPVYAGAPYMVGEEGPEVFVPDTAGAIVPNHAMGGGGGGVTLNIDARGAEPGVEARIRQVVLSMMPMISASTRGDLFNDVNRGGTAARTLGRRAR